MLSFFFLLLLLFLQLETLTHKKGGQKKEGKEEARAEEGKHGSAPVGRNSKAKPSLPGLAVDDKDNVDGCFAGTLSAGASNNGSANHDEHQWCSHNSTTNHNSALG